MKKTMTIIIEELANKKVEELRTFATALKKEIEYKGSITKFKKAELVDFIINNAPSDQYWFIHDTDEIVDSANRVLATGKTVPAERVEESYRLKCANLSQFEISRAKEEIAVKAEILEVVPEFSWENIYFTHRDLQHRVCHQKREITKQTKVLGSNLIPDCTSGYFTFDLSKVMEVEDIKSDTVLNDFLFNVAVPNADLMETCEDLGVRLVTFDPEGMPLPNGMELEQALTHAYKYGIVDVSVEDLAKAKYFPIGLSASKARSGGVIWLANVADWNAMEKLRAKVLHLTDEEYEKMKKDKCVIAKFETGTIGMRTSSVINVSKAGKRLRGDNSILNDIKCKVIPDIEGERELQTLEPDKTVTGDMRPFSFKLTTRNHNIVDSDGMSIMKLQQYMNILHQCGEITDSQYMMFSNKWALSNYNPAILIQDEEMHRFLTSKDFKPLMQVRFFGGVKGTVVPVVEMDRDERLAGIDMLVFNKSAKYVSENAPFEVINFAKSKKEVAQLNYQFIQSSGATADVLIKGAARAFESVKNVLSSSADALKFIAGVRNLSDDGDDLLTKLAQDLEVEPRLITEHYHQGQILDKVRKFVKEIGYGRIPVKGNFKYIIADPVYLYHKAMGDDFDSALEAGQFHCNGIAGKKAGMFRSPMIHYSEPQVAEAVDIDYLWLYKDIVVLNVKDGIASSLGGADYDGDKILLIIDENDNSFESLFVQSLLMPGYIIHDEGNQAPKVENTIENRIKYYVNLSTPNRTGQITNWATWANDLMINARNNGDTKAFNWYKSLLVRLRFAQGWEIDLPKTGVSADGPDGDMLPTKFCKPTSQPQWFVDKCNYEHRSLSVSNPYKGNSPMQLLHDYAEAFWSQIEAGQIVKPNTVLEVIGESLTEAERETSKRLITIVSEYESFYRNETRNIFTLMDQGIISSEEQKDLFETLIERHRVLLNSLLGDDVTTDVLAYTCYYVSNYRKNNEGNNEKISGKRSYVWTCYRPEILALLYRNNKGMSLVALPDREMDNIEIVDGELLIDGRFVQSVEFPDGSYSIKVIDDKPFIVVPKVLPVVTEQEKRQAERAYAEKVFAFECNAFTAFNQKLNSEQFVEAIKQNGNQFDVLLLTNGSVAICMNGLVYATIKECPQYILNKRVCLVNHGDLLFLPKAKRATTLMKDSVYAYNKMLHFEVMVKVDETPDMNVTVAASHQEEQYSSYTEEDMQYDYQALAQQFGWND